MDMSVPVYARVSNVGHALIIFMTENRLELKSLEVGTANTVD